MKKVNLSLFLTLLIAMSASAATNPSGLLVADCINKEGLGIAEVYYAAGYGSSAPITIEVNTDSLMGNFGCNANANACGGIEETTGNLIKATVTETTPGIFVFAFQSGLAITCNLPAQ